MSAALRETGVNETLTQLSQLECLTDVSEDIFAPLANTFDAESMVLFRQRMDGPQHCLRPVVALNQARDVLSHYLQKISPLDPSMPYWRSVANNAQYVWSYSDVQRAAKNANPKRFDRFLNERANVSHMLMMSFNIGSNGNDSLLCALHRAPGQEDFTQDERQIATNFAPVMRQVYRALASAETETVASALAYNVLTRQSDASQALVDVNCAVICGDDAARDVLGQLPASAFGQLRRALQRLRETVLEQGIKAGGHPLGEYGKQLISALPVDQSASQFILTISAPEISDTHMVSSLTPRQMEVAELVAKGCRNWQVAELLGISENTVVNHLAAIYDTLAIGGRMELALLWKTRQRSH